jgi:hypothetical protein
MEKKKKGLCKEIQNFFSVGNLSFDSWHSTNEDILSRFGNEIHLQSGEFSRPEKQSEFM